MSENTDFANLLSQNVGDAKEPSPLPPGTYRCAVSSYEFGHTSRKQTPYCRFHYSLVEADADVDEDDLEAFIADQPEGKTLADVTVRDDFYLTQNAMFMLKNHLENNLGMDCDSMQFDEAIPEAVGQEVMVTIKHVPSQDGSRMYTNVENYAKAE